jgi:hypothetical protein
VTTVGVTPYGPVAAEDVRDLPERDGLMPGRAPSSGARAGLFIKAPLRSHVHVWPPLASRRQTLVNEVLSRHLRDGEGLARAGNARVRCGMIQ